MPVHLFLVFVLCANVQMSPFKSSTMKGGSNKGKEPVIDVDDPSQRSKRTRFSTEVYDPKLLNLMLHSRPIRTTFEMLHCWLNR